MKNNNLTNFQREADIPFDSSGGYLGNKNGTILPPKSKQKLSELSIADLNVLLYRSAKFFKEIKNYKYKEIHDKISTELSNREDNIDWDN